MILNVLETIPGLRESLVFDTFASLLAAVVKKRTDPEDLPGLEAMMPESALVRLLNRPDVRTNANLRILGGDVEGTGFWGRLKAFVTDLYYREDHDLDRQHAGDVRRSRADRHGALLGRHRRARQPFQLLRQRGHGQQARESARRR